jgi:hypothetical protein
LALGAKFKKQFIILGAVTLLLSCGKMRQASLVIHEEASKNQESAYHGLYAREKNQGAKRDRLIIDLHYDDWVGAPADVETGWRSIAFNLNGFFDLPLNTQSTLSIASGLRFGSSTIQHDGLFLVQPSIPSAVLLTTTNINFHREKQRFRQSHIEIPLEIRLRGKNVSSYRLYLGASSGVLVNSFEKWREGSLRFREYNHPNLSRLRFGGYIRLGYQRWCLYGSYFFTPLFTGTSDTRLNQLQIGLSVSIF